MQKRLLYVIILLFTLALSSCSKFEDIQIKGVEDVKFNGMKDNKIFLTVTLDVENPNKASVNIKTLEFKAWLNNREFGTVKTTQKIKIKGNSRNGYEIPLNIQLRTAADALKLMTNKEKLLKQMTVEGYIKGGKFPVVKKLKIAKQPLQEVINKYK